IRLSLHDALPICPCWSSSWWTPAGACSPAPGTGSCCRSTWWWRASCPPTSRALPCPSPRSRPTSRRWTSARRAWPGSRRRCPGRGRCSGTARWASSRWRRSPPAPAGWRRRSPRWTGSPWSAAGTPPRRCAYSGSTSPRSGTSRPAGEPRWSTWRARPSPASPHWRSDPMATTPRRPLMAGNWKMNLNHLEAIALVQKLAFTLTEKELEEVEVVVLPPFTDLRSVQTLVDGDKINIGYGAQDLSPHQPGAYTGDIAAGMLAKLGCRYVVVGHSERRAYHHEDDALIAAKVAAALANDLTPILCVGEGLEVREAGEHVDHTLAQLDAALAGRSADEVRRIVVAYEP